MKKIANDFAALDYVLNGLMRRYRQRVPDVERIIRCMVQEGVIRSAEDIENDHIAFRTMGVQHLGIHSLEKMFLHYGYERKDFFAFEQKKLDAYWYSPPLPRFPRVFISQLRVPDLPRDAQRIIQSYTCEVLGDPVDDLDLDNGSEVDAFLHRPLWRTPSWPDYQRLLEESEYAAWVIYNRYYLNHFTVSIHQLPTGYNTVGKFNEFLKRNSFRLNNAGGEIKTSSDGLLLQSSTVAATVDAEFRDAAGHLEKHKIAGSYVEFAERRVLPEFKNLEPERVRREHRRDGFEVASADKIFESTYSSQTKNGPITRGLH